MTSEEKNLLSCAFYLSNLFHFYCLLRAHLLAAETADTLSVIIYRRLSFAFSEIHSFPRNRTALHTDPAADTFISFYIWFFLKNV